MSELLKVVRFEGVNPSNIESLRALNRAILPVNYQDKIYDDILACGDVTQLAFIGSELVGAIACRLEQTDGIIQIYIVTLGVLGPYRSIGIGSALVEKSFDVVQGCLPEVTTVYLHVQADNEDAIRFYTRLGFSVADTIRNYYKRANCPDAVLLRRQMHANE